MRILVIEDDLTLSSYIARGLKQAGFAVDGAADGEEGLALAELASWDAMVVDIMLPKLDGLSLIERLRRKGLNTPALILSARQSDHFQVALSAFRRRLRADVCSYIRTLPVGAHHGGG